MNKYYHNWTRKCLLLSTTPTSCFSSIPFSSAFSPTCRVASGSPLEGQSILICRYFLNSSNLNSISSIPGTLHRTCYSRKSFKLCWFANSIKMLYSSKLGNAVFTIFSLIFSLTITLEGLKINLFHYQNVMMYLVPSNSTTLLMTLPFQLLCSRLTSS